MRFQQENCFNTAMPYGLRRVESSHMMLTRSVTALVPFVAQEVQSPQGIFYGRNAITGNLIVGDRTKLINGNAMVIATSGSGKSMSVKMEIIMEFLRWPNARFILVDPENEYELLVKALGGEAIKVSVDSRTHFNPRDYHYDPKTDVPPDVAKIEFVLSMLDKLIGENGHLQPEDRSLIAASLKNIYKPLIASGYTAPCPTLGDLYRNLNKSNLRRAKQLALMLDVFANGSLQAFSHTTNVDMNNHLICFNIQSLGDQLRPIAMMSLLEFINMQVMTNRRKDATAATWIYFDEIHVLLKDPMSSNFLYSSWKRFRKYNAYATGISQDIQDYLDNPVAYALLSNSEFVIMLRQSKSLEALERLYGLSKPQLEFLRNASEGHGIIKILIGAVFTTVVNQDILDGGGRVDPVGQVVGKAVGDNDVLDPVRVTALHQHRQLVLLCQLLYAVIENTILGYALQIDFVLSGVLLVKTLDLRLKEDRTDVLTGFEGGNGDFHHAAVGISGCRATGSIAAGCGSCSRGCSATAAGQAGGHHGSGQSACEQLLLFHSVSPLLLCFFVLLTRCGCTKCSKSYCKNVFVSRLKNICSEIWLKKLLQKRFCISV